MQCLLSQQNTKLPQQQTQNTKKTSNSNIDKHKIPTKQQNCHSNKHKIPTKHQIELTNTKYQQNTKLPQQQTQNPKKYQIGALTNTKYQQNTKLPQ